MLKILIYFKMTILYESFLKKIDRKEIFNEVFENIYNYMEKKFKDYKDYNVMKYDFRINSKLNIYDKISLYERGDHKNDLINIEIDIRDYDKNKITIKFANSVFFKYVRSSYIRSSEYEFDIKKIDYNKIYSAIDDLEEYSDTYHTHKFIDEYSNKNKLGGALKAILTKDYDSVIEYIMSKDNKNVKYIDFKRCSKEIRNKYEHLIDANNFDLI